MSRSRFICQKGFALVEILLALAIFGMLASALAPSITARSRTRSMNVVVNHMLALQSAVQAYYSDTYAIRNTGNPAQEWPISSGWPDDMTQLAEPIGKYLPAWWEAPNPFGNNYYMVNTEDHLVAWTYVPDELADGVASRLPVTEVVDTVEGKAVVSIITPPEGSHDTTADKTTVDKGVVDFETVWVSDNIRVNQDPSADNVQYINWWPNYHTQYTGNLYGNYMKTHWVKTQIGRVADNPDEPNIYDIGLTMPKCIGSGAPCVPLEHGTRTRYMWAYESPQGERYVTSIW